ncbi:MAG: glycosyltransferase [Eggerthellaceae bacterium]|jgi:hypothetical protein|nr:glycosyltransferase [Eggerthellaceae bacterium]MCH4220369.1 glycosyltransferase [Eggerthellaceae bacterium]
MDHRKHNQSKVPSIITNGAYRDHGDTYLWIFTCITKAHAPHHLSYSVQGFPESLSIASVVVRGSYQHGSCMYTELSVRVPHRVRRFTLRLIDLDSRTTIARTTVGLAKRHQIKYAYEQETANACVDAERYRQWFEAHRAHEDEIEHQKQRAYTDDDPLMSIITPVFNTPSLFLQAAIESVRAQSYGKWEYILVNASPENEKLSTALASYAQKDQRISIVTLPSNQGIAANTNQGISVAQGDYLCFMDHDDTLEPNALYEYVQAIKDDLNIDLLYCDEDSIDEEGTNNNSPLFKPNANIDLLYSNDYVIHFLAVSKRIIDCTERSNARYDGAQDYDLTLKSFEHTQHIQHVSKVLYHWRQHPGSMSENVDSKPYAQKAGRYAIADHLKRCAINAHVDFASQPSTYRAQFICPTPRPTVTMVIPFDAYNERALDATLSANIDSTDNQRDPFMDMSRVESLQRFIDGTSYESLDIRIGIAQSDEPAQPGRKQTLAQLQKMAQNDSRIQLIPVSQSKAAETVLWSDIVQTVVANTSHSSYVLIASPWLLPNDPHWLDTLVGYGQRATVGAVAPRLIQPDGLFAGMAASVHSDGSLGYLQHDLPADDAGYVGVNHRPRDVQSLLSDCVLTRTSLIQSFYKHESMQNADYALADYCLTLASQQLLCVYTPYVQLYGAHLIQEPMLSHKDARMLNQKWHDIIVQGDPTYNSNLDSTNDYWSLPQL